MFKDVGNFRKNLLLHSDPTKRKNWNKEKQKDFEKKHIKLFRHPNPNKHSQEKFYVEIRIYFDPSNSFSEQKYPWKWDENDKRTIKRIKKGHRTR